MTWPALLTLAAGTYLIRLVGLLLPRRDEPQEAVLDHLGRQAVQVRLEGEADLVIFLRVPDVLLLVDLFQVENLLP